MPVFFAFAPWHVSSMERDKLTDLTRRFTATFNLDDLDGMVGCFADEGLYVEFDGTRHEGRDAVRAAFEPHFAGKFGTIRFDEEDLFVDPVTRKSMISWTCRIAQDGRSGAWRGLDILHFNEAGEITEKLTYAKARKVAFEKSG